MIPVGEALGAAGELIKYLATKDDRARAEVMWAVEQAVMVFTDPEPTFDDLFRCATAILDYVYAEAARRHPPVLAPTGDRPGGFDTEQDSSGKA